MPYTEDELTRELLYEASFLDRFDRQMSSLKTDVAFVEQIATIRNQERERFGESLQEGKRFATNALYKSGAARTCKALGEIVASVIADGYAMMRGAVSPTTLKPS